ncbi:MAG: hypothetical protein KatS3mg024_2263 [Armatimonadota bacterium]|nr:MAG: hypothetical protein KatS3mg024_2263 [Armatimonadota bacterium]
MLIARRRSAYTVFAMLIQAEKTELPNAQVEVRPGRHGTLRARVTMDGLPRPFDFSVRRLTPPAG